MADQVGSLNLKLGVDGTAFGPGLQRASGEMQSFADRTRGQSNRIEQAFANLGGGAREVFSSFTAGGPSAAIGSLTGQMGGLVSTFTQFAGLGGTFAVGFVAGFATLISMANDTAKKLNEINKLGKLIGENGQETQVLQKVFENAGFDADASKQILLRFFDKIGDLRQGRGEGATGDTFRRIGLDPLAIADSRPTEALQATIEAINRIPNAYDRASASQQIFGRSFAEMADIVRRGGQAFNESRDQVNRFGADTGTLSAAGEAARLNRQTDREYGSIGNSFSQFWNEVSAGISLAYARGRRNINDFGRDARAAFRELHGFAPESRGQAPRAAENRFALDAAADRRRRETAAATTDATKFADEWRRSAENAGLTARQIEIAKAQQAGVSASLVEQLRARDRELTMIEERNRREAQLRGILDANRTASEKFFEVLAQISLSSFTGTQQNRLLASSFRDLERSLGGGGSQSFAISGIDPRSVEGARFMADLATRRSNGAEDPQNRIVSVLEAIREIEAEQARETAAIADAIRNQPNLFVAGVR